MASEAVRVTIEYLVDGEVYSSRSEEVNLPARKSGESIPPSEFGVRHVVATPASTGRGLLDIDGRMAFTLVTPEAARSAGAQVVHETPRHPVVGSIVHYTRPCPDRGKTEIPPHAAIIVNVADDDRVDLLVWGPQRDDRVYAVRFDANGAPRSWNWPARA